MVVAVGNLAGLWMDLSDDIRDLEILKRRFEGCFSLKWADVMTRADMPFSYHQHWNAYMAVSDLKPLSNMPLPTMLADFRNKQIQVFQVLAG